MSEINWFSFENKDLDFPIYNENPHVAKWGWIVLFFCIAVGFILMLKSSIGRSIVSMLIPLIALLYFLKWDINAIFQKPKAKDVGLAFALFIGYFLYAKAIDFILGQFGIYGVAVSGSQTVTLMTIPPIFFSIMTEEFVKLIPFLFFLRVMYKYSNNRKLSVIVSMFIVMIIFASMHAFSLNALIFAIFLQGFGSIFEFIGYIKTKNVLVCYLTHLFTDLFIYSIVLLGLG